MLRLTVSTEEYLMIGEDIRLVFLGGTGNHLRIMVGQFSRHIPGPKVCISHFSRF